MYLPSVSLYYSLIEKSSLVAVLLVNSVNINLKGCLWGFPGGAVVRNPPANTGNARDMSLIPGSKRYS